MHTKRWCRVVAKSMFKPKLRHIQIVRVYLSKTELLLNQKGLGALHQQGAQRQTFIEKRQKQSEESVDWL